MLFFHKNQHINVIFSHFNVFYFRKISIKSKRNRKARHSTLLCSTLYSLVCPLFSYSPALLCIHLPQHTLIQPLRLHVQPSRRLLQSRAYTRSQRYLPPNSDYESDNSIFFASSGISTSFSCLSFFQYYEFFLIIRPYADFFLTTKNSWHFCLEISLFPCHELIIIYDIQFF